MVDGQRDSGFSLEVLEHRLSWPVQEWTWESACGPRPLPGGSKGQLSVPGGQQGQPHRTKQQEAGVEEEPGEARSDGGC